MNTPIHHVTIGPDEDDTRLDRWLKRHYAGLTQGHVEKLCRTGQVRVDGARVKPSTRLTTGASVRVPPLPKIAEDPEERPRRQTNESASDRAFIRSIVLHEDDEIIALNKPAGLAVQGGTAMRRHVDGMLGLLQDGEHRPKLVHRLDKETSGVLVVAKTPAVSARLSKLFKERELDKVYWAVTVGVPVPQAGQIRSWMIKDSEAKGADKERMRRSGHGEKGAVHAITDYVTVTTAGQRAAWVALKPKTGRTHQLRFHMEEIGTSILGDDKYLTRREVPQGLASGLHLHARALILPRRSGRPLTITAPLPGHMKQTFATLGFLEQEAGKDPLEPFL